MTNAINWFELPVHDLERARRFYETVLGASLRPVTFGGLEQALFPYDGGVGGALIKDPKLEPSAAGTVVYLDASGRLDAAVRRVEEAGGRVVLPKTDIGDPGFIAMIVDTEGNRVGLHAPRA